MTQQTGSRRLLLSAKEAQERLGISRKNFLELVRHGELPYVPLSRKKNAQRRFAEADLVKLIDRRRTWLAPDLKPKPAPEKSKPPKKVMGKPPKKLQLTPRTKHKPSIKLVT